MSQNVLFRLDALLGAIKMHSSRVDGRACLYCFLRVTIKRGKNSAHQVKPVYFLHPAPAPSELADKMKSLSSSLPSSDLDSRIIICVSYDQIFPDPRLELSDE